MTSGAFTTRSRAEAWIARHRLTGMLIRYPVDTGVWDWAVEKDLFQVRKERHATPEFIGRFTSAFMEHWHYTEGVGGDIEADRESVLPSLKIARAVIYGWYDGPVSGGLEFDGWHEPFLYNEISHDYSGGPRVYKLRPISLRAWREMWAVVSGQAAIYTPAPGCGAPFDLAWDAVEASADLPVALVMDWSPEDRFAAFRWLALGESPSTLAHQFYKKPEAWQEYFAASR